jgi:peptidoglycan/xylan/chitin deacetylase (PgdA/CDA1 family)/SAM-dependent methyltransferase
MPAGNHMNASADPLVSVVFLFPGAGRFAGEAIESVQAQTLEDWELILVHDGLSDSDVDIAASCTERRPGRVSSLECGGACGSDVVALRNAGVCRARGRYLAFLDADDVWLPDRLASQAALVEFSDASMVYGLSQYWYSWTGNDDDLDRDFIPEAGVATDILYAPAKLLPALYPIGPAAGPSIGDLLIARELFERIGGFEKDSQGSDADLTFRAEVCLGGSVYASGKCWNRRRIHTADIQRAKSTERRRAERARFLNWLTTRLDREGITDPDIRSALARAWEAQGPKQDVHYKNWHFRAAGSNEAELEGVPDRPDAVRITILKCDSEPPWDIQLNLRRLTVLGGRTYRVRFEARADSARSLNVGVSMAREPWLGLGLYRAVDMTTEWKHYEIEFVAEADFDDARIHFDVGGSAIGLQVAGAGLFLRDGSPAPGGVQFGSLRRVTPIGRDWGYDRGLPIDRYYIAQFLNGLSADIRGRVLEIGDNIYTLRFGGNNVTRSDVVDVTEGKPGATIIGDLCNAPHIPDNTFDCIVLTQTLQYIYDLRAAIQTLYRILKAGGVLLATIPAISPNYDRAWGKYWYWNFTPLSARRLFAEAFPGSAVDVQSFGNVLTATSFLHGVSSGELTPGTEFDYLEGGYEVTIGIRAVKPLPEAAKKSSPGTARAFRHPGSGRGMILMYHRISEPDTDPFALCVTPAHFAEHLGVIRRDAKTLTLTEMADCVRRGRIPDRSIAITFDDGYADNLQNAKPLLQHRGIPATVFVTTGNPGRRREFWWDELQRILLTPGTLPETLELNIQGKPNRWELGAAAQLTDEELKRNRRWRAEDEAPTRRHFLYLDIWRLLRQVPEADRTCTIEALTVWSGSTEPRETHLPMQPDQIAALADGGLIEIGAHSVTHPSLRDLSAELQRLEITGSKDRLEQILGSKVTSFAYPYGALSAETPALVRGAGFERACTTLPRAVGDDTDCFQLPRVQVDDWDETEFSGRLAGWFSRDMKFGQRLIH